MGVLRLLVIIPLVLFESTWKLLARSKGYGQRQERPHNVLVATAQVDHQLGLAARFEATSASRVVFMSRGFCRCFVKARMLWPTLRMLAPGSPSHCARKRPAQIFAGLDQLLNIDVILPVRRAQARFSLDQSFYCTRGMWTRV